MRVFFSVVFLSFFCLLTFAQTQVEFKDITNMPWKGTIKTYDRDGFQLETAEGIILRFNWDELMNDDVRRIKFQLGVITTTAPKNEVKEGTLGVFKGVKLKLKSDPGTPLSGIIVKEGTDELNITIQSRGKKYKFSRNDISSIEEETIPANEVFDAQQLYQMIINIYKPGKVEEHIKVAEVCSEYKLDDKAEYHFRLAEIASAPHRPESKITHILKKMEESSNDEKLNEYLYLTGKNIIDRNYDEALKILEKMEKFYSSPDFLKHYKSLRQEINYLSSKKIEDKVEEFYESLIIYYLRTTATDRKKSFGGAIEFILRDMQQEILKKISSHIAIDERTIYNIWNKRQGKANTSSYGNGSWIVDAPKLGNPEEWWESATNTERFNFITAFFAEKFMKVINVNYKDCSECGASGKLINNVCPYCKGIKKIRIVHYK